jgi:16S rRNA (adenine1518-N6/adenine1519-N6)-dimethyltransferase
VDPSARGETLVVEQFARIAEQLPDRSDPQITRVTPASDSSEGAE